MIKDAEVLSMVEELVGRASLAVLRTVNRGAEMVFEESQKQVPKGPLGEHEKRARQEAGKYPVETLEESGRVELATPLGLTAQVIYGSPYAAAQEAGVMPFVGPEGTIEWSKEPWGAENYTTTGTKSHYLEDPAKMIIGQLVEELAVQGRIAFGELSGPVESKSTLRASGHRVEAQPAPSGPIAAAMRRDQQQADLTTSLQTPSHPPLLQ